MKQKSKKGQRIGQLEQGDRWLAGIVGALGGYFAAEILLRGHPHPLHWLATLAIGALSYGGMVLRQRFKHRH
ncbi:MAG: hypothetical protein ACYDBJ_02750 [Aggregatilineales bacterium]